MTLVCDLNTTVVLIQDNHRGICAHRGVSMPIGAKLENVLDRKKSLYGALISGAGDHRSLARKKSV